jgi:hypothetical protein
MGRKSRNKGKRGELALAVFLSERGFDSRRGRQYSGDPSAPEIISTLPLFIECERTETLSLYPVVGHAQQDAGDKPTVIFHRRNSEPWIIVMTVDEFLKLIKRSPQ